MSLEGKVILLIGHTGGIGKVVYEYLAKQGATVIGDSKSTGLDITSYQNVSYTIAKYFITHEKIDAVVNCTGVYGHIGQFDTTSIILWDYAMKVNFYGPVYLCHSCIPFLKKQGFGKIILFGGGGFEPLPNFSAYTSSKFALIKFAETIAEELKNSNIQVNVISPGLVDTQIQDSVLEAGETAGKFYEKIKKVRELGEDSYPDGVAELVTFLLDSKITGKVISAKHDDYRDWNVDYINTSPLFTVKRLDKYTIDRIIE